jgi:lipoate-protein ligase B
VPYADGIVLMKSRVALRRDGLVPDALYLLEHPHVITVGRRGSLDGLLVPESELPSRGISLHRTERGGDLTYHGPGQLVGYPIVGLRELDLGPKRYVVKLEEVLIRTIATFGIEAARRPGYPGVWVGSNKIAALGIQVIRGVTAHGFALNVATDTSFFQTIVPCGIRDGGVTTITRVSGRHVTPTEVVPPLVEAFGRVFQRQMTWTVAETHATT